MRSSRPPPTAGADRQVAVHEEGESTEHALLAQAGFAPDDVPYPVGKLLVIRHLGHDDVGGSTATATSSRPAARGRRLLVHLSAELAVRFQPQEGAPLNTYPSPREAERVARLAIQRTTSLPTCGATTLYEMEPAAISRTQHTMAMNRATRKPRTERRTARRYVVQLGGHR